MRALKQEAIREADVRATDNAVYVRELEAENARLREVVSYHGLNEALPTDDDREWASRGGWITKSD